ncbi:hypothetical protein [Psychrobacter sp. WY6]|nr:hypothetical protein [Psychrobacter sp. WY6]
MSNLKKVTEQWQALTDQLNDLMGMDAPVFAPVTDLLVALTQHLRPLIPEYSDTSSVSAQESVADTMDSIGESAMSDSSGQAASTKNISSTSFNPSNRDHQSNRQQALKLLGQIQDYFSTNEPHSPVTFLLGRAIDWADMPLDQWLTHIIKNEDQLAILSDMIGIKPKRDSSDDGY